MNVAEAKAATHALLAAVDQKLGVIPEPAPTLEPVPFIPVTPVILPAPAAVTLPIKAKTRIPPAVFVVGSLVGAALLIGITAAAVRSREREQFRPTERIRAMTAT